MAKVAKTAIKKSGAEEAKNYTKVIKSVRNPKTGAYSFREKMVLKEEVDEFLKK